MNSLITGRCQPIKLPIFNLTSKKKIKIILIKLVLFQDLSLWVLVNYAGENMEISLTYLLSSFYSLSLFILAFWLLILSQKSNRISLYNLSNQFKGKHLNNQLNKYNQSNQQSQSSQFNQFNQFNQ